MEKHSKSATLENNAARAQGPLPSTAKPRDNSESTKSDPDANPRRGTTGAPQFAIHAEIGPLTTFVHPISIRQAALTLDAVSHRNGVVRGTLANPTSTAKQSQSTAPACQMGAPRFADPRPAGQQIQRCTNPLPTAEWGHPDPGPTHSHHPSILSEQRHRGADPVPPPNAPQLPRNPLSLSEQTHRSTNRMSPANAPHPAPNPLTVSEQTHRGLNPIPPAAAPHPEHNPLIQSEQTHRGTNPVPPPSPLRL